MEALEVKNTQNAPLIRRYIDDFLGVDYASSMFNIDLRRSPKALNVYKDYSNPYELVSRPVKEEIYRFNGIHRGATDCTIDNEKVVLIHNGTKLYKWENYPTVPPIFVVIKSDLSNSDSVFFSFNNRIYFKDQENYLYYDGVQVKNVLDEATIPTTSFNRSPSGGGEQHNPVNCLQPKRINSFVGDGTSTEYYLDVEECDSINEVKVNGEVVNNYGTDITNGKITFSIAPPKPDIMGQDNVEITFTKRVNAYIDRILKCSLVTQYDNRMFFSGNPLYPNAIFNSQREDPNYVPDISYYEDGLDTEAVKSMVVGNRGLYVLKTGNGDDTTVYFHQGKIFYEDNVKVYPSIQTIINEPCTSEGINFNGEVVYITLNGLQGIIVGNNNEFMLDNRSSNLGKHNSNIKNAILTVWKNYLLVAVGGTIYVADNNKRFQGINGIEYEWYHWYLGKIKILQMLDIDSRLYIFTDDGRFIYLNDNADTVSEDIECLWTTPSDILEAPNKLKTFNKKGFIVYGENLSVSVNTDKKIGEPKEILKDKTHGVFKNKSKKALHTSVEIKGIDKEKFVLNAIEYEAYITRYAKR